MEHSILDSFFGKSLVAKLFIKSIEEIKANISLKEKNDIEPKIITKKQKYVKNKPVKIKSGLITRKKEYKKIGVLNTKLGEQKYSALPSFNINLKKLQDINKCKTKSRSQKVISLELNTKKADTQPIISERKEINYHILKCTPTFPKIRTQSVQEKPIEIEKTLQINRYPGLNKSIVAIEKDKKDIKFIRDIILLKKLEAKKWYGANELIKGANKFMYGCLFNKII